MALPVAQFRSWVIGQLVKAADLLATALKVRELVGMGAFAMTGQTAFLPASNGVQVIPGTGMQVKIGGLDQTIFLPDPNTGSIAKAAYSTGQVAQAINAADPSLQRNDLICVQFSNPQVNGSNGSVLNNGVVSNQTVYDVDETFAIDYVPGTPGGGDPPVPSGWTALARVIVPAAASSIITSDIQMLLSTTTAIFKNLGVASLNALVGAITLTSPDSSIAIAVVGQQIQLKLNELIVNSVNGLSGGIQLVSSDGSVIITPNDPTTNEIDLQVPNSNIGQVLKVIGSNGSSFAVTLPGPNTTIWVVEAMVYINSGSNFEYSTLGLTGGTWLDETHSVQTQVGGGSGQNAMAVNVLAGRANGGQTLTFDLSVHSGSFGGDYYQSITATRVV